jgi:hypothetical protein
MMALAPEGRPPAAHPPKSFLKIKIPEQIHRSGINRTFVAPKYA